MIVNKVLIVLVREEENEDRANDRDSENDWSYIVTKCV